MISTRYNDTSLKPWHVVFLICVGYALATLVANGGDPMAFVAQGNLCDFIGGVPPGVEAVEGYDGQFAYMIAADPAGAHARIDRCDVAAYRYQRILYPVLARALALWQGSLVPWTMVLVNLIAIPAGTYALEQLLMRVSVSRWYALSYGLFGGVVIALRLDLAEPLAYGLALAGIWAMEAERPWLGAGLFALGGFSKETALFMAGGYLLHRLLARRWGDALRLGMVAVGPFVAWQGVLWARLGSPGVGSGGAKATSFEWFPYNGVWRIVTDAGVREKLSEGNGGGGLVVLLILMALALAIAALPSMWALWQSGRDIWTGLRAGRQVPHVYGFLLFANAAVMPFVPFSTYREPLGIMRFVVGLVIAVVLYGAHARVRRPLNYSLFWAMTLIFALSYAFA